MENTADRAGASKSWVRTRHKVISILLYPIIWLLVFFKYGVRPERFRGQEKGPYLILYNHQTPMDQFFVGASFPGAVYYLATEDIFSNGWISALLRWLVAPIPIRRKRWISRPYVQCCGLRRKAVRLPSRRRETVLTAEKPNICCLPSGIWRSR